MQGTGAEAANENVNVAVMREAVVMQMTAAHPQLLYYGDEAGVCGFTLILTTDVRIRCGGHEDQELIAFHRERSDPQAIPGVQVLFRCLSGGNVLAAHQRSEPADCVVTGTQ